MNNKQNNNYNQSHNYNKNNHNNYNTAQTHPSFIVRLTIALTGLFAFLQVYSIQAILPVLMTEFHLSEVKAGLLVSATVLGFAIMSPIIGMLSDAIGRKRLIVLSLILLTMPTVLMATATDFNFMLLLRFLQGISVPGITVITIAYVGEEYQGNSVSKLMSYYVSGAVLGGFLGRFILGHLHEIIGWQSAFLVMGALTALGVFWVGFALPQSRQFTANPNFASSLQILAAHFKNRQLISACLLGFCVLFTLVGCFTFVSLYLSEEPYLLSTGQLGNIFIVYLLGVVITPITVRLIQAFGASNTAILAVTLSMLGVLLTLFQSFGIVVFGLAIMSCGVFITQSSTISYIAMQVNTGRSLASGLYHLCYYIGGSVGAWGCGLAYRHGGWQAVVVSLVSMQLFALLIIVLLIRNTESK